jgi:hypothetical protein
VFTPLLRPIPVLAATLALALPTLARADAPKAKYKQYASASFRYTSQLDLAAYTGSDSLWKEIDVDPSFFQIIEYGYAMSEDFSLSVGFAIPNNTEELARSLFLGLQAGGWTFSVETGYLGGTTENTEEVFTMEDGELEALVPVGQEFRNRYLGFSALWYAGNTISWGASYVQNRVPRTLQIERTVSGSAHEEAPDLTLAPNSTAHIVGFVMQMSPTKALSRGYRTSASSMRLVDGPEFSSFLALDVDMTFGLAYWSRDESNDEFIRERVTATPADGIVEDRGRILSYKDTPTDFALVGSWRLEWLNQWNVGTTLISAGLGIEGRVHTFLPLTGDISDPDVLENDIILSYGYDSGNIMWGPYLRVAAAF